MRSPGRVLILLLSAAALQGSVTATLNSDTVKRGGSATLSIRVEGENTVIPKIERLCGVEVMKQGYRRSLEELENGFEKAVVYTYTFRPESACVIEPIAVEVDGIESYTPPLKLDISDDASAVVELSASKQALYVGEPFEIEAVFNRENAPDGVFDALVLPDLEGFWIKKKFAPLDIKEGKHVITKYRYLLSPQQSGRVRINPVELKLAVDEQSIDAWGNPKVERYSESYYSNALDIQVSALPDEVVLVGDFTVSLTMTKHEVAANRPLNALITISGYGNFEDISPIEPHIIGVNVFAGELKQVVSGDGKQERWQQELVFVAENNFTIPAIRLNYFDPEERRVRWVQTKAVPIHVIGAQIKERVSSNQKEAVRPKEEGASVLFVLGAITAAVLILLSRRLWQKKMQKLGRGSIEDYRYALRLLLAHREEPDAEEMIMKLEASLYGKKTAVVDKKALKKLLQRYQK